MPAGVLTGLVLESGHAASHAVAVVDGCVVPHVTRRLGVAGGAVARHLLDLLQVGSAHQPVSASIKNQNLKDPISFIFLDVFGEGGGLLDLLQVGSA